jgi:MFS family permease
VTTTSEPVKNTGHPLRSFKERNVRIFFGGIAISSIGTWAQLTVLVLLVRDLGGGGLELGIVTACRFAPLLFLGLYAGAVADRVDRHRRTMQLQAALGVLALVLGFIDWLDWETLPVLYGISTAQGFLTAFDNPTRRTMVTELVPPEQLANVLALSTSVMTGSRFFGPALGALLAGTIGTHGAFFLNGISYLFFLVAMNSMDTSRFHLLPRRKQSATPIRDGLREVWADPVLRITIAGFALIATFAFNHTVAFPLMVTERLNEPDETYGYLLSVMSLGSLAGSLFVARLVVVSQRFMWISAALLGGSLAAFSFATSTVMAFVLVIPLGAGMTLYMNSSNIIVQQRTSPEIRSRVLALISVIFLGSTPIGGPITGIIGDAFGALWANLYGALIVVGALVAGLIALKVVTGSTNPAETAQARAM